VKEVGNFVTVDVADLGMQIYWDKGTRINLQLDQKWKNRVRGIPTRRGGRAYFKRDDNEYYVSDQRIVR